MPKKKEERLEVVKLQTTDDLVRCGADLSDIGADGHPSVMDLYLGVRRADCFLSPEGLLNHRIKSAIKTPGSRKYQENKRF